MRKWQKRLKNILKQSETDSQMTPRDQLQEEIQSFLEETVLPAFKEIKEELSQYNRQVQINYNNENLEIDIIVYREGKEEFYYGIRCRFYQKMTFAFPLPAEEQSKPLGRAEVVLRVGQVKKNLDMNKTSRDDIIEDFLGEYEKWIAY